MINLTTFVNGARDVVSNARGTLSRADTDMADEEFDCALDHLRIARETIERAERAIREIAKMAEEQKAA